jgi:dTDP-4-amino-4,6-dideoxygalactose transaminase
MSEPTFVPLAEPVLAGNERAYLDECLRTNFVSSVGPFVERFEREFAAYVGAKHAVACASGTAALHVAMRLAGIERGDEVFCSTMTFIASASPVSYQQGALTLIDAEFSSWNLSADKIVAELDRRKREGLAMPKAVEVVHILGHPADLAPIAEACAKYGIFLIEDAAEALGARYRTGSLAGQHVGTIGQVGCYSFNGNKIITTGGGGMLTTDDPALAKRAKHLTTQARLPGAEYRHDEVGYNYRLTNVAAAMGVAQLEQLPAFLAKKKAIADRYDEALAKIDGLSAPPRAAFAEPSHWLYTCRVSPDAGFTRQELMAYLDSVKIQARPVWTPLHFQPMYAECPRLGGEVAETLFAEGLSLPCSVSLTEDAQNRVIAAIAEFAAQARSRRALRRQSLSAAIGGGFVPAASHDRLLVEPLHVLRHVPRQDVSSA